MTSSVKNYDTIDVEKFNFTKPEKFNNSYFGAMSYGDNNEPIYIQTPKLRCNVSIKDIAENKQPYLEVIIPKNKMEFYDLLTKIDDKHIKKTFTSSEEWFGKELPLEAIDDMYKPITKSFKKDSEPKVKFKLPIIKNKIHCTVYNQQKNSIDISEIKENDEVILILHLKGLKVLKQFYLCDCYISQIKLFQDKDLKYNIIDEYSIIDDGIDNEDDLEIFDEELIYEINKEKEEKNQRIEELKKQLEEEEKNINEKKKLLENLQK